MRLFCLKRQACLSVNKEVPGDKACKLNLFKVSFKQQRFLDLQISRKSLYELHAPSPGGPNAKRSKGVRRAS